MLARYEAEWRELSQKAMEERNRALVAVKHKLDRSTDGRLWGMWYDEDDPDIPYGRAYMQEAIKDLSDNLFQAIKDIPKYGTVNRGHIENIILSRMDPLREKYDDLGCADSEGRYGITDTLELYFEICA